MLFGAEQVGVFSPRVDDSSRRRIVGMVLFIYVLLIVEGVLRKWVLPEFGQVLFFVRDPFVLAVYAMALVSGHWPRSSLWLTLALLLALLTSVLAILQVALGVGNPQAPMLFAAYGLRNYFFYIPLAFIIADTFRAEDLQRMAVITFALVILSAVLVVLQFYSPVGAAINVGISDDPSLQFRGLGLNELHTRPMGFFTSDVGQKQLSVSALAMVLAGWSGAWRTGGFSRLLLPFATLGVLTCLAYSGSRGAVLSSGLVVLAAMAAVARGGRETSRGRVLAVLIGMFVLVTILGFTFFADGIAAFVERWNTADGFESQHFSGGIFGRAIYGLVDFLRLFTDTPLLGYGIGMAGNAAQQLAMSTGMPLKYSAETDWARHMVDLGPVVGVFFMTFRIALVFAVARRVVNSRSVLATLLFGYLGYELLLGQITGHGTINGYAWMFVGFTLAAAAAFGEEAGTTATTTGIKEPFPNLLR